MVETPSSNEALLFHFLHGGVDELLDEDRLLVGIRRRADAGPQQLVERQAEDQRFDDERRVARGAAGDVHAAPAVAVVAPQGGVVRVGHPLARRVDDFRLGADRAQRDDALDAGALEPRPRTLGGDQLLARRHAVGGDAVHAALAQLAGELLLARDAQILIVADHERRDLLAGEADAGGFWRLPHRRELRLVGCHRDDGGAHDSDDRDRTQPRHGRTVTAAASWNCSRVSAGICKCSVPWLDTIAPVAAPTAAPIATPVPPPARPPMRPPRPAPAPTFLAVFLPSPAPCCSTYVVTMS